MHTPTHTRIQTHTLSSVFNFCRGIVISLFYVQRFSAFTSAVS